MFLDSTTADAPPSAVAWRAKAPRRGAKTLPGARGACAFEVLRLGRPSTGRDSRGRTTHSASRRVKSRELMTRSLFPQRLGVWSCSSTWPRG